MPTAVTFSFTRLCLQRAIQSGRVVDRDVVSWGDAAIVGDEGDTAVLLHHLGGPALEDVAILPEDVTLQAIIGARLARQHKDVAEWLDRNEQPPALPGPVAP